MTLSPWIYKNEIVSQIIHRNNPSTFKIVDIGCGVNPIMWDKSTNVDTNTPEIWIQKMQRQAKEGKINQAWAEHEIARLMNFPNFVKSEAEKLPFSDLEFDYAILSEVLEHVDSPEAVLNEAQRVARILIMVIPNEFQWDPSLKPFTHPTHKNYFTEELLYKLVRDVGLQRPELIKLNVDGWSHFIVTAVSKSVVIDVSQKTFITI
jgi:ubiquinone/menaquinone biosynthesis C-methylase UbiE